MRTRLLFLLAASMGVASSRAALLANDALPTAISLPALTAQPGPVLQALEPLAQPLIAGLPSLPTLAVAANDELARVSLPSLPMPAANMLPSPVLKLSGKHKHVVVVDLPRARLYVLENIDGQLKVVRQHYAAMGKKGYGKQTRGDNRTPVGVYQTTTFTAENDLPDFYGAGAFPLNYPNLWDFHRKRTGDGIWLHGVPPNTYSRPPLSSEGCVTMANPDLTALKPYINAIDTPIVLTDTLDWVDSSHQQASADAVSTEIENWRQRWSAMDTEGYLSYYAPDFTSAGLNKAAFSEYKRHINSAKNRINVQVRDLDLFRYPGEADLVMAQFTQDYDSDNYKVTNTKQQFWKKQPDGKWMIVLEESH